MSKIYSNVNSGGGDRISLLLITISRSEWANACRFSRSINLSPSVYYIVFGHLVSVWYVFRLKRTGQTIANSSPKHSTNGQISKKLSGESASVSTFDSIDCSVEIAFITIGGNLTQNITQFKTLIFISEWFLQKEVVSFKMTVNQPSWMLFSREGTKY